MIFLVPFKLNVELCTCENEGGYYGRISYFHYADLTALVSFLSNDFLKF